MNNEELLKIGYEKGLNRAHEKGYQGELAKMYACEYAGGYVEGYAEGCEKVKKEAYERDRVKGENQNVQL